MGHNHENENFVENHIFVELNGSIFSIISLVGFIIIIYGFSLIDTCNPMMADCETDNFYLWNSFEYSREISFLLMPISRIFIVASQIKSTKVGDLNADINEPSDL